jgi:hypothetical protein
VKEDTVTYYKATRPDGRDFYSVTIDYAAALTSGEVIRHTSSKKTRDEPSTYISVSVEPADCTGFSWPCRLFRVEPVGRVMANLSASPNKRAVSALRVVEELPSHLALGPNGEQVAAFIERLWTLTPEQARSLDAAWSAAWAAWAAWDAARAAAWAAGDAARDAARAAAWAAARAAAWAAARAIVVRDLITEEQYAILTRPFRDVGLGEWVA